MSFNVAALVSLGYDDPWLPYSVLSIYPVVDRIYILFSIQPWRGRRLDSTAILSALRVIPDPDKKIKIIHGSWANEKQQRNYGLSLLGADRHELGMIVDPDEIYDPAQLARAFEFVSLHKNFECFDVGWYTYWKRLACRIDPVEQFRPTVFIRRGAVEFTRRRSLKAGLLGSIPSDIIMCHHLSFVRSDNFIRDKLLSLAGQGGQSLDAWFNNIWKGWDNNHSLTNLHPIEPSLFPCAVIQSKELLPPILQRLYQELCPGAKAPRAA